MANLYEEFGLEMENEDFGVTPNSPTPPPATVKKGGLLGKGVALLLGVVLGVGGTVGGVAGAGYYIATQPIKNTLNAITDFTGVNIDISEFLSDSYAEKTVVELVGSLASVAGKFTSGSGCLNDLVAISPYVSTAIDPLLDTLRNYGLSVDKAEFMATPLSNLANYIGEEARAIELPDLLESVGVTLTPILDSICHKENGEGITVGELMDNGPEALLENLPLEALLISENGVDPSKDSLIMALAYGNANRYTVGEDNKVVMNQMLFRLKDGTWYDVDGNEVTVSLEDGVYTATIDGKLYYLKASETNPNEYLAYEDSAQTIPALYKKVMLSALISGNASDLINNLELGSLLNVSPLKEDSDPITLALAYGEKGVHYNVVDGEIVWIGDNKPRTIGTLMSGELTSILNDMQLGTLLGISPLDNYNADPSDDADPLMLALAYGYEGEHYNVVDGELVWIGDNGPKTILSLTEGNLINDIRLGTILGVDPLDGSADALTLALAYGYEGEHYNVVDGEIVWIGDNGPRTVEDMSSMGSILNEIRLGTVLGVDPLDESADALTIALSYGYEGVHYNVVGDELVWIDDNKPRTVEDMSNMGDILNEIRIETALSVTHESPRLLHVLSYGSEGTDFEYVKDSDGNVIGITNISNYNTIADLSSSEDDGLINSIKLKDLFGADAIDDDILLRHLGEETLTSLPESIGNLTFKKVYAKQIYTTEYAIHDNAGVHTALIYDETLKKYYYDKDYAVGEPKEWYTGDESLVVLEFKYLFFEVAKVDADGNPITDGTGNIIYESVADPLGGKGFIIEDLLVYNDQTHFYHYYVENPDGTVTDYKVHLSLTPQWKYLLVEEDHEAHDYPLTNFDALVENMMYNMQSATLQDMVDDGILSGVSEATLNTKLVTKVFTLDLTDDLHAIGIEVPTDGTLYLRDLTITQMLNYTALIISVVGV